MSSVADPVPPELRAAIDAAVRRADTDAQRLGKAFLALPDDPPGTLSKGVFDALRTARRNAFASMGTLLALETRHPVRDHALSVFSLLSGALTAFYGSLRSSDPRAAARQDKRADEQFAAAAKALAALDRELGCPYGCKEKARA
jgi:hypothetical protein